MAVNKYGNDFKNNIMWNQEYPFIPEVTNDDGLVIKENEIYEYYERNLKIFYKVRIVKIYNKDYIWGQCYDFENSICDLYTKANNLLPYLGGGKITPDPCDKMNNEHILNEFRFFTNHIYADLYRDEISLPNDWHADPIKYNNKLNEEVALIKNNKINIK